ncbi:universal stress protein UspA [Pseudoxanthomonas kalamensis DSM 18571]|uniref:universal stress protein n=1 Tax=Pseudoxanthomonas kalamensis TaxID=289483 RepID=UPI00139134AF|nr:universal stress protein [Pseudoxanthomonas kalamensis]KAF1712204.1 universal stress protein UspA [Pseudoxanthomonas kalamensis DSM 18571]
MYKHILIATDGSELAQKGVDAGLALAATLGAEVLALTVSEPIVTGFDDAMGWATAGATASDFQAAREQEGAAVLQRVQAQAQAAGVALRPRYLPDRYAAEAIIETAQAEGCDLVVMASHGRRGLNRLLLGSQANEVLMRSQVPVLVIR